MASTCLLAIILSSFRPPIFHSNEFTIYDKRFLARLMVSRVLPSNSLFIMQGNEMSVCREFIASVTQCVARLWSGRCFYVCLHLAV